MGYTTFSDTSILISNLSLQAKDREGTPRPQASVLENPFAVAMPRENVFIGTGHAIVYPRKSLTNTRKHDLRDSNFDPNYIEYTIEYT